MTATTILTARELISGSDHDSLEEAIAQASADQVTASSGRLQSLGPTSRALIAGRIGRSFSDSLDADITNLVATAWMRYDQVSEAIERTRDEPTTSVVVPVVDHTMTAKLEPAVDVTFREVAVTTVAVELVLDITAHGIIAVFKNGKLTQVRGGALIVGGQLTLEGVTLAANRTQLLLAKLLWSIDPEVTTESQENSPQHANAYAVGSIVNGHRWTGNVWQAVDGYCPGDIVNGHRLSDNGQVWIPVTPTGSSGREERGRRADANRAFRGAAGVHPVTAPPWIVE